MARWVWCIWPGRPAVELVAVKVVRDELAGDDGFRARFAREIESARKVSGAFTAAVVDADPDADRPWLATEYLPGPTLQKAIDASGPLTPGGVRSLAGGLAEALSAIHRSGLVHRDLKPSNIVLTDNGPRVIDFGIARALEDASLTATGVVIGTPGYLSPEQITGTTIGPPSDMFAMGAALVFAASGRGPFATGNPASLLHRIVHEQPQIPPLPDPLQDLVRRCLARDPAHRPTPPRYSSPSARRRTPRSSHHRPRPSSPPPSSSRTADSHTARRTRPAPRTPATPRTRAARGARAAPADATAADWRDLYHHKDQTDDHRRDRHAARRHLHAAGDTDTRPVRRVDRQLRDRDQPVLRDPQLAPGPQAPRRTPPVARRPGHHQGVPTAAIPWSSVTRIRIVGDVRRPWLVAWLTHEATLPTPIRLHHGGRKLYPVAHERPVKRRNHQLNELRAALNWYAGRLHDNNY